MRWAMTALSSTLALLSREKELTIGILAATPPAASRRIASKRRDVWPRSRCALAGLRLFGQLVPVLGVGPDGRWPARSCQDPGRSRNSRGRAKST